MLRRSHIAAVLLALSLLGACGGKDDSAPLQIAFIGQPDDPFDKGLRLTPAAQQIHAATSEGLVAIDAQGEVVPALAERCIVT
jgi:hypothetical protein